MVFLQWFTATQMFEVYATERENDRNVISGWFTLLSYMHLSCLSWHVRFDKLPESGVGSTMCAWLPLEINDHEDCMSGCQLTLNRFVSCLYG